MASRTAVLYLAGWSERKIARRFGLSQSAVHRRLVKEGVPRRPVFSGGWPTKGSGKPRLTEVVCEVCKQKAMRRSPHRYSARQGRPQHQLCGRKECRAKCLRKAEKLRWLNLRRRRRRWPDDEPRWETQWEKAERQRLIAAAPSLAAMSEYLTANPRRIAVTKALAAAKAKIAELELEHSRLVRTRQQSGT